MAELKSTLEPSSENRDWLSQPLSLALRIDWELAIYITLIVLGIITRFWGLGDRVVSHDESLHTQYSYQYFNGDGYVHTPLMHGPFLFHVTAFSYWLFGHSDFTARIPVAILGVILIAMPYFLRDWLGRKGALFTSFIFLISPYVVYYSRYIRHDVPAIVWALIIFIATWHYLRGGFEKAETSLFWFAGALALLFATKEVSYIYVAIFGSFLIYRLGAQIVIQPWFGREFKKIVTPLLIVGFGVLLLGFGLLGKGFLENRAELLAGETAVEQTDEPDSFAADPTADATITAETDTAAGITAMRWVQIVGLVTVSMGLFLVASAWRSRLTSYPEFDLIVLYTVLILPTVSPLLSVIVGWNPLDYNISSCVIEGQETMGVLTAFLLKLTNSQCWSIFLTSGVAKTALFLFPLVVVSVLIGLWWRSRTFIICAAIFHVIFFLLYTSVFTNPGGWMTGTVGSLGYWLEQQDVQRGSQPEFYYAVVMPLYEFLPLIFTFAAMRLWAIKERIHIVTRYIFWSLIALYLTYSYRNWRYNFNNGLVGDEQTIIPGLIAAGVLLLILAAIAAVWLIVRYPKRAKQLQIPSFRALVQNGGLIGFVPALMWWFVLTIILYTWAGEKMPWLSIHFVIPMAFLAGWYFNERLKDVTWESFTSRRSLSIWGVIILFLTTLFLSIEPLFRGEVDFGGQASQTLSANGRFIGSLILTLGLGYALIRMSRPELPEETVNTAADAFRWLWERVRVVGQLFSFNQRPTFARSWMLAIFALLALLTIRFSYMANFPNADYSTEFLVYAHGAPATKEEIMPQIEELSMRLYGDKSIQVVYDNESSWPYTWYLREYPNRRYVGENPSPDIADAPVLIIGNSNWSKFEPYLRDEYDYQTYTYLWWPMEDYRQISWEAILGNPDHLPQRVYEERLASGQSVGGAQIRRGLGNPDVRASLWDIFFYRDYTTYGQTFNKSFDLGQWPLRDELRLYVRRDVRAELWDYGVGAFNVAVPENPYAERELLLEPTAVIGAGELTAPRNATIGPDGRLYVADSGNHRIAIFEDGVLVDSFGQFGALDGEFNEPWGIAADEEFIYVADTWNHRVQKFTLDGEFVTTIGQSGSIDASQPGSGGGLFFGPRDIALLGDGRLAITDTGNHRIQLFTREGEFLSAHGGLGPLAGQFFEPVGLESFPDGSLYVADMWNRRIQQIDTTQEFVPIFEWEISAWESELPDHKPYLASDSGGRLYVTDPEAYRVLIFDRNGQYLGRFGQFSPDSSGFGNPTGITVNDAGEIYVVDAGNSQVLKFAAVFEQPAADSDVEESSEEIDEAAEPADGADNIEEEMEETETDNSEAGLQEGETVDEDAAGGTAEGAAEEVEGETTATPEQ